MPAKEKKNQKEKSDILQFLFIYKYILITTIYIRVRPYFPPYISACENFYFSTQHTRFREFRAFWALSQGIGHSCVRVSWPIVAHIRALWQPICSRAPLMLDDGLKASTRALGRFPRRGLSA